MMDTSTTDCASCIVLRQEIRTLTDKRNVCIRQVESVQEQLLDRGEQGLAGALRAALGALKYG